MSGIAPFFFAAMGLFFFLPPLGVIAYKLYFRLGCRKAYGQVVRIEKVRDEETDSMMLKVLISFQDEDGRRTEIRNGIQYGLRYMPPREFHGKTLLPARHPTAAIPSRQSRPLASIRNSHADRVPLHAPRSRLPPACPLGSFFSLCFPFTRQGVEFSRFKILSEAIWTHPAKGSSNRLSPN